LKLLRDHRLNFTDVVALFISGHGCDPLGLIGRRLQV